jgi:hypothetical protein
MIKMFYLLTLVCAFTSFGAHSEVSTEQLNSQNEHKLVQIKIVNRISGRKVSIGSGFFVDGKGLLATNYHVVRKAVLYPEDYQVKFVDSAGKEHFADVIEIDVLSDLALVQSTLDTSSYLTLSDSLPDKGVTIFSMGNPSDIGMMVVPGTYNGIRSDQLVDFITFSGAINGGMSGGPVINSQSLVVGINVRSMPGKQIGFLVPVDKLKQLMTQHQANLKASAKTDFYMRINQQLMDHQKAFYQEVLTSDWPVDSLGSALVPQKILSILSCWGDSNEKQEKRQYQAVSTGCNVGDNIGIDDMGSRRTYVGSINYNFEWIQSDSLNSWQLAQLYQRRIKTKGVKNADRRHIGNYFCKQDVVVNSTKQRLKTTICTRSYRKFAGLYDVVFAALLLGKDDQGLVAKFNLTGVSQDTGQAFTHKFVESIKWN